MKYYSSKKDAIAEAVAMRKTYPGIIVRVIEERKWIPGTGRNVGYTARRYYVATV